MEPSTTKPQQASRNSRVKRYPRKHILAATVLGCMVVTLSVIQSEEAAATRHQQNISLDVTTPTTSTAESKTTENKTVKSNTLDSELTVRTAKAISVNTAPIEVTVLESNSVQAKALHIDNAITAKPIIAEEQKPELAWKDYTVKSGDSLALIFKRAGLPASAMYELINKAPKAKGLTNIHPGRTLSFAIDDSNKLQGLRYRENRLNCTTYNRTKSGFERTLEKRKPEAYLAYRNATIKTSLFDAGTGAGMSANLIMEFANIFGWDIDFALDIRKGDHFNILFEEQFLDGEKIGNGRILAAEFNNQGESFKAVRYENSKGEGHYFTPDGKSMRKAFLRAPLDFTRISSNFNPRRLHPIHKTVRPHRGTDYAASRGTPVYSSGNGRVIKSAYNKASGNYIVVQHSNNIQTKYLHLHKRKVKKGQRVRQKQLIGTVGSTGYSTAPHLHYEFLLNGVHRNPRTILQKLPKAKAISKAELAQFNTQTQSHLAQLNSFKQDASLALNK